jgi:glycosyltransferase involved in cell wall biosynthesis
MSSTLRAFVVAQVEALTERHLHDWQPPSVMAGHVVGPDVRADLAFTLAHLRDSGITSVASSTVDDAIDRVLRPIDGTGTHTFFSYRVAETIARFGSFADNALIGDWSTGERENIAAACDSTEWIELLDAKVLPANYAAVLARCELARQELGLPVDATVLDDLVSRTDRLLGSVHNGGIDDDPHGGGRYDIYSLDLFLFCEPFAERLPSWTTGLPSVAALVHEVVADDGTAVAWGRSTGLLGLCHTIELAALQVRARDAAAGSWLAIAERAARELPRWFREGLTTAHQHRSPYGYRGPARRLQLTLDALGKLAWAAHRLAAADPIEPAAAQVPAATDTFISFETARPLGVWSHRSGHVRFVLPVVGTVWSDYLPAPRQPGLFEVPVDRPLPCWTPTVVRGEHLLIGAGAPESAGWIDEAFEVRYRDFVPAGGLDPGRSGPSGLAGSRHATARVDRRTITFREHLTFEEPPAAVVLQVPEAEGQPLVLEISDDAGPVTVSTVDTDGIKEWRSFWGELPRVHQAVIDGTGEMRFTWSVTPALRVASDATHHWYHRSLYDPMGPWVLDQAMHPPAWEGSRGRERLRTIDCYHLHWPEWMFDEDADAARRFVARLRENRVALIWTQHNLLPHREGDFAEVYGVIAAEADGIIHHSEWGRDRALAQRPYRDDARHVVIPHGHWAALGVERDPEVRAAVEAELGLTAGRTRLGIVGAPRPGKRTVDFAEAFARSHRDDLELAVLCLEAGDEGVVPDDPRIVAMPYEFVDRGEWNRRLAAIDVLVFPFDADTRMLTTGVFADAIGAGLPSLVSGWGFLTEVLGTAGIPMGDTPARWTEAVDSLSTEAVERARNASRDLQGEYDWSTIATRTRTFLEDVVASVPR